MDSESVKRCCDRCFEEHGLSEELFDCLYVCLEPMLGGEAAA